MKSLANDLNIVEGKVKAVSRKPDVTDGMLQMGCFRWHYRMNTPTACHCTSIRNASNTDKAGLLTILANVHTTGTSDTDTSY